jgi:uncharacterized protein
VPVARGVRPTGQTRGRSRREMLGSLCGLWGAPMPVWARLVGLTGLAGQAGCQPKEPSAERPVVERISWEDLMPSGWDRSGVFGGQQLGQLADGDPRAVLLALKMRKAWDEAPANEAFAGRAVRLVGFIAPTERSGTDIVQFLLVPFFGSCIHTPPPPANQIIRVTPRRSLPDRMTHAPVWLEGVLTLERSRTHLGVAAYAMAAQKWGVYQPE